MGILRTSMLLSLPRYAHSVRYLTLTLPLLYVSGWSYVIGPKQFFLYPTTRYV